MNEFICSLAVALAVGAGGTASLPGREMETVIQDDAQLLYGSTQEVRKNVRTIAEVGADRVRLTASWAILAPDPTSPTRPDFDAADSRAYPDEAFERLDTAVREVDDAGLDTMIDVAFFAPAWAVDPAHAEDFRAAWAPSPAELALFTRAVAERYSGRFPDPEGAPGEALPAVRLWTTWNEPNHSTFLRPQWVDGRPFSPHHYRAMHNAAYDQLKAVSEDNRVLIGGLASFEEPGRTALSNMGPLRFTRELACVDEDLQPLKRPECHGFAPLRADGFAHHPYSRDTAPDDRDPTLDRVQIGELDRLTSLLARLYAAGRLERPLALYLTEYGYETAPPDPDGRRPADAARFLGEATFLAWRSAGVAMFPQFLLQDVGPDLDKPVGSPERWSDWQSGLFNHDGPPKPEVLQSFRLPFHVEAIHDADGAAEVMAFGQVRPLEGPQRVGIERLDEIGEWVAEPSLAASRTDPAGACGAFATDGWGFWGRRLPYRVGAIYRSVWTRPDGSTEASPPVRVGLPRPVLGGAAAALQPLP